MSPDERTALNDPSRIAAMVDRLAEARLLVAGDVMLDRFIYGRVDRISPEAPIPILTIERETQMLGGAGNVVRNLSAVGAACCFVSLIGNDEAGRAVMRLIADEARVEPHLIYAPDRSTTIKIRYVTGSQQLLRADQESSGALAGETAAELLERAMIDLDEAGAVILSDYGKGALGAESTQQLVAAARSRSLAVVIDPKGNDYSRYAGATVLTPNRRELAEATRLPTGSTDEIVTAARRLTAEHGIDAILVTRSQDGMSIVPAEGEVVHLPAEAREVYDVSGAGDTVAAVVGAGLAAGLSLEEAAHLANIAAGVVVGKQGTAVARAAEIATASRAYDLSSGEAKTVPLDRAARKVAEWREKGLKVAFTNGCFDLLHPGHVSLLAEARNQADRLIVGLNSDASVRRLKGASRPIQSEAPRSIVLGSLASVDMVVIFDEDTPIKLIEKLRPDVLVKGSDYTEDQVVGGNVVRSYGGRVHLAQLIAGHSTTATVRKLNPDNS